MALHDTITIYNFMLLSLAAFPGCSNTGAGVVLIVAGVVMGLYMALYFNFALYPCNYIPNTLKAAKKPSRHLKSAYIDGAKAREQQQQHNYAIISRRCNIVPLFYHISKICCFLRNFAFQKKPGGVCVKIRFLKMSKILDRGEF